jgi:cytochrome P450
VRLYAPSHATARTATRDTDVGQQRVRMGEVVAMVFLAANHDPAVFTDPHAFSLERVPNRHIGFGHGVHKCGGQSLARLQLRVALQELLAHTAHFQLDGPVDVNTWPEYGPKTLPLRLATR